MTCVSSWWAMCASMFLWRPVTFCGCSKPTVGLGVAKSGKFTGRFRLTTAWLSRKWLWEMFGAGPAQFRQWCHGYVVTPHKAQGSTADHVVVAAERLTAKGAYVACSRGRKSCIIHTPDKERLVERLPEGNRCAALDVLSEISTTNAPTLNRVSAWKQLAAYLASQIARRLNQSLADNVHAQTTSATYTGLKP